MLFQFLYRNTVELSRDVSFCERIDANTLLHCDGSVYVLSGMPDHFTSKWVTYTKKSFTLISEAGRGL